MIEYIKLMIADLIKRFDDDKLNEGLPSRFQALASELEGLHPRDFLPALRFEFVNVRRQLDNYLNVREEEWACIGQILRSGHHSGDTSKMMEMLNRLELGDKHAFVGELGGPSANHTLAWRIVNDTKERLSRLGAILDSYLGPEAQTKSREFTFVREAELRKILERDYRELTLKLFPTESWKSVVILAGSILEGLLHDLLTRDAARMAAAMTQRQAPNRPRSAPPPGKRNLASTAKDDQWLLNDYIEVADALTLLPQGWKASVQAVLRDFRNYVHPRRELVATDKITQGEALMAMGALMRVCDHIQNNHP